MFVPEMQHAVRKANLPLEMQGHAPVPKCMPASAVFVELPQPERMCEAAVQASM